MYKLFAALLAISLPTTAMAQPHTHQDQPQGGQAGTPASNNQAAHRGRPGRGGVRGGQEHRQSGFHGPAQSSIGQGQAPRGGATTIARSNVTRGNARSQQPAAAAIVQNHSQRAPGGAIHSQQRTAVASNRGGEQFVYRGQTYQSFQRAHYVYPRGWGYRRWQLGQSLPFLFLNANYFVSDYYDYGFGPPMRGYVWVRYGPDLLLVSRRTGRIAEVVYDVFY